VGDFVACRNLRAICMRLRGEVSRSLFYRNNSAGTGDVMKSDTKRGCALLMLLALTLGACSDDDGSNQKSGFSFKATEEAAASDVGLPDYPGSKPYKDEDQTSPAANVGISTPLFGLKVVVVNLETADEPERVAAFYKSALAQYGKVLDCSDAEGTKKALKSDVANKGELVCSSKDSDEKVVYKVGTEKNQRAVMIKAHESGTRFSLVHVNLHK
jgi:hypothetical protein